MELSEEEAKLLESILYFYDRSQFFSRDIWDSDMTLRDVLERLGVPSDPAYQVVYYELLRDGGGKYNHLLNLKVHGKANIDDGSAQAVCLRADDGSNIILSEGTVPGSGSDACVDIGLSLNESNSADTQHRIETICAFINSLDGDVTVVGHSLGGFLAMAVTYLCPDKVKSCYAFNAPKLPDWFFSHYNLQRGNDKIRSVDNPNDNVHKVNDGGNAVTDGLLDQGDHTMDYFVDLFTADASRTLDFSEETEQELIRRIRESVSTEGGEIFSLTSIFGDFVGGILDAIFNNIDNSYKELERNAAEQEEAVRRYFSRGREIEAYYLSTVSDMPEELNDRVSRIKGIFSKATS